MNYIRRPHVIRGIATPSVGQDLIRRIRSQAQIHAAIVADPHQESAIILIATCHQTDDTEIHSENLAQTLKKTVTHSAKDTYELDHAVFSELAPPSQFLTRANNPGWIRVFNRCCD